jgi:succinate dehydrogenase hydrophobic anchor subunit
MRFAFLVAIVTTILRIFLVLSMKRICHREQVKTETRKFHFLKYKPFAFFILPNLIRGLCAGAIGMAVSIGYYTGHLDSRSATLLAVITSLVTILGCGVYALIAGKIAERTILILSSIGVFLFMPMITWFPSTEAFLVFYGFAWFMVVFINYAVPVAVTKIADYETMGRYSAGRMLLHNGGTMLAGFLCIPLFQLIGIQITMVLFAGMQCISGICYYIYMKKNNIR